MSISLAIGLGVNMGGGPGFTPALLFAGGKQGVWYDPSDFGTMFQDSAGSIPAAVGQPVGLMLDKSQGLAVGSELVTNGDFSNGATGWSTSGGNTITFSGGVCHISGSGNAGPFQDIVTVPGKAYLVNFSLSIASGSCYGRAYVGGSFTTQLATTVPLSQSGSYQLVFTATSASTRIYFPAFNTPNLDLDYVSAKLLAGNHATQGTSANRPTLQVDGNGRYYLAFNGTNSSLVTGSIDFTGTAQISVFAGLRKLSDAAQGTVCELTANAGTTAGGFSLQAPSAAASSDFTLTTNGGSAATSKLTAYAAPVSDVVDATLLNTSGTAAGAITPRVNAATPTITAGGVAPGGANFANAALNIGARSVAATPSLFFNGNLYGLCVVGKTASAAEITSTESYLNDKTRAY